MEREPQNCSLVTSSTTPGLPANRRDAQSSGRWEGFAFACRSHVRLLRTSAIRRISSRRSSPAFHEAILQHETSDAFGVEPAGDIESLTVDRKGEERPARADDHGRAVRFRWICRENGERGIGDVEDHPRLPRVGPVFFLLLLPVFGTGSRTFIETNDFFLSDEARAG